VNESTELDCFCGVIVERREVDSGVQGQGAVTLEGICSMDAVLVVI
jgi:hypothetical protein